MNKKLEEEVAHLKTLLVNGTSIIQSPQVLTNEELVCIKQIQELKYVSDNSILTLEDSKKLDTYVKVLKLIRATPIESKDILRNVNTEDLLKVVESVDVKA